MYAETSRYNYGPVCFLVLEGLARAARVLPGDPVVMFRLLIVAVITIADAAIALVLWRRFSWKAGLVAWLAPITMFVAGAHNQFENVAVALALAALVLLGERTHGRLAGTEWAGLAVLGLSLATKHIVIFFVIALVWRQQGVLRKMLFACVPVMLFALSFLPFATHGGADGIRDNVLAYRSYENFPFGDLFLGTTDSTVAMAVLVLAVLVFALVSRGLNLVEAFATYLVVLVVFAPAVAAQQMVLLVPWVAINLSVVLAFWMGLEGFVLVRDGISRVTGAKPAGVVPDWLFEQGVGNQAYGARIALFVLAVALTMIWRRRSPRTRSAVAGRERTELDHQWRAMATWWGEGDSSDTGPVAGDRDEERIKRAAARAETNDEGELQCSW